LGTTNEDVVSIDIIGCNYSALIDLKSTMVIGDHDLRVLAWYDNEWRYALRCADLVEYIAKS
jgi:glyceraldehyde 3-phosphate dehydrogenase